MTRIPTTGRRSRFTRAASWTALAVFLSLPACAQNEDPLAPGDSATNLSREAATSALATPPGDVPRNQPRSSPAFVAVLSGDDAGVETLARGAATFRVAADGTSIQYRLVVADLNDVTMAHIHLADEGTNGPPVAWLYPSSPPMQLSAGRNSGVLATGTLTPADLVGPLEGMGIADLALAMAAGDTYVNVHTEAHPGGEIRDQIFTGLSPVMPGESMPDLSR